MIACRSHHRVEIGTLNLGGNVLFIETCDTGHVVRLPHINLWLVVGLRDGDVCTHGVQNSGRLMVMITKIIRQEEWINSWLQEVSQTKTYFLRYPVVFFYVNRIIFIYVWSVDTLCTMSSYYLLNFILAKIESCYMLECPMFYEKLEYKVVLV